MKRRFRLSLRTVSIFSSTLFLCAAGLNICFSLGFYKDPQTVRLTFQTAEKLAAALTSATLWPLHPQQRTLNYWLLHATALSFSELSLEASSPQALSDVGSPIATQANTASTNHTLPVATQAPQAGANSVHRLTIGWVLDTGAKSLTSTLHQTPGLSVLAPKWWHVDGPNGALAGTVEPSVITTAKQLGVRVWAVVDNGFNGPMSHSFLQFKNTQDSLIRQLTLRAKQTHIAGINLDFEGLLPEDRWNYARFVSQLAYHLHLEHKSLSIDLPPDYVNGDNTGPYNHAALAKAADYIILMGYDQHWGGDTTAGPTASLPWVASSLSDMLHTGIPAAKLILGVPFYTQDWTVAKNGQVLSSQPLSLWQVRDVIANHHIQTRWDRQLGLHFGVYMDQGVRHEIWVEDNRSLLLTLQLVARDHLAGAAAWYLGLEYPSTWLSLTDSVRSAIA